MINELYKKGDVIGWLILRPQTDNTIKQEIILGKLTDDVVLMEGDEAYPLGWMKLGCEYGHASKP